MAQTNEMIEGRYVNDWLKAQHPTALVYGKMRVGKKLTFVGTERLYPDRIFIEDNTVFIVEAKVKPSSSAIGQLNTYAKLFPETDEFFFAKDYPLRKIFLTTRDDVILRPQFESENIEYVIYLPDWLNAIIMERLREAS